MYEQKDGIYSYYYSNPPLKEGFLRIEKEGREIAMKMIVYYAQKEFFAN